MIETIAQEITDEFSFLDTWEDRFSYIIDLGKNLPISDDELFQDQYKVSGCASQVWLRIETSDGPDPKLSLQGTSDAILVKGLIALLLRLYDEGAVNDAKQFKIHNFFEELGLSSALTQQRSNGLSAMIKQIEAAF